MDYVVVSYHNGDRWVGLCAEYPKLRAVSVDYDRALDGIRYLVRSQEDKPAHKSPMEIYRFMQKVKRNDPYLRGS